MQRVPGKSFQNIPPGNRLSRRNLLCERNAIVALHHKVHVGGQAAHLPRKRRNWTRSHASGTILARRVARSQTTDRGGMTVVATNRRNALCGLSMCEEAPEMDNTALWGKARQRRQQTHRKHACNHSS